MAALYDAGVSRELREWYTRERRPCLEFLHLGQARELVPALGRHPLGILGPGDGHPGADPTREQGLTQTTPTTSSTVFYTLASSLKWRPVTCQELFVRPYIPRVIHRHPPSSNTF